MPYDPLLRLPRRNPPTGTPGGVLPTPPTAGNLVVGQGATWASKPLSGDATLAASGALTLANTGVSAGTYGDGTHVARFTVDSKGRLTFAGTIPISANAGPPGPEGEEGEPGPMGPPGPRGADGSPNLDGGFPDSIYGGVTNIDAGGI